MISVKEAKEILSRNCGKGKIAKIHLRESLGHLLAEDIYSSLDVPSFDNSAMDGYAMDFKPENKSWEVTEIIQAGDTSTYEVSPDTAVRIFTGAKMPKGADTVIPQELIEQQENRIYYDHHKIETGSNVRRKGSQCKKGDQILRKGTEITPGIIGLLASVGISELNVYAPPSVAFIITGNELTEIGEDLKEGKIYNSNGPMVNALLRKYGVKDISEFRAGDDKEDLQKIINRALDEKDVLILSGGISVGDYDFVKDCLETAGVEELFYKVRQRPGKPMFAGRKEEKWIFALPGNPASVLSCFVQYVKPCLETIMGKEQAWTADSALPLAEDCPKKNGFTVFMKGRKEAEKVVLLKGQQSFNLLAFSTANCLVELEEETDLVPAGTKVNVYDL